MVYLFHAIQMQMQNFMIKHLSICLLTASDTLVNWHRHVMYQKFYLRSRVNKVVVLTRYNLIQSKLLSQKTTKLGHSAKSFRPESGQFGCRPLIAYFDASVLMPRFLPYAQDKLPVLLNEFSIVRTAGSGSVVEKVQVDFGPGGRTLIWWTTCVQQPQLLYTFESTMLHFLYLPPCRNRFVNLNGRTSIWSVLFPSKHMRTWNVKWFDDVIKRGVRIEALEYCKQSAVDGKINTVNR